MQVELSPRIAKNKVIQELALKRWVLGHKAITWKCPAHSRHNNSFLFPIIAKHFFLHLVFLFWGGMEKGNAKVIQSWARVLQASLYKCSQNFGDKKGLCILAESRHSNEGWYPKQKRKWIWFILWTSSSDFIFTTKR